jgi:hypothetical protein
MRQVSRDVISVVAVLAVGVCLAFVAAGCGGRSDDDSAPSGTSRTGDNGTAVEDEQDTAAATAGESGEAKSTMTVKGEDGTVATMQQTGEDAGTYTVTDAQGKETFSMEVKKDGLPTGFPEDFPVYKGKSLSGSRTEGEDAVSYVTQVETPDSADTVTDWYKKALADKGYELPSIMQMGTSGNMIMFQKGKSSGVISIGPGEGKTDIAITITESK